MPFRDENVRFAKHIDVSPQVFSRPNIAVELRPCAAKSRGHTAAFLLALSLLSRTFERVYAVFPSGAEAPDHPWNLGTVCAVVEELNDTVDGTLRVGAPDERMWCCQ